MNTSAPPAHTDTWTPIQLCGAILSAPIHTDGWYTTTLQDTTGHLHPLYITKRLYDTLRLAWATFPYTVSIRKGWIDDQGIVRPYIMDATNQ